MANKKSTTTTVPKAVKKQQKEKKEKPQIDMREFKGARLFTKGHVVVTPTSFYVQSEKGPEIYEVNPTLKTCECIDYQTREQRCKHLWAIEFYLLNEKQKLEREQKAKEMVI